MKVIVKCEKCNNEVELTPLTVGQHAYVRRNLQENNLRVFETRFDKRTNLNADKDFLGKLAKAKTENEIEEILEDDIDYQTDTDIELEELRFDCSNCGDYIVLTEFK
ncbi:hypothetical protein [Bacillus coahuilensis]|uniref:hypothetical protein n=1 Tax=Bacillus coahuilensis TaxID=408580 RepID=UPI000185130A|nr:hypothetical protein [Bacillus coahuilensis]